MDRKTTLFLTSCLVALGGCDVRHTLGLDHYQPDEFNMSDKPPLSMPKDYKLRPPVDAAKESSETKGSSQAAQKVLGVEAKNSATTNGEKDLLTKASQGQAADPHIRETVNKDAAVDTTLSGKLTEKVASWKEEFKQNVNSINTDEKS